MKIEIVHDLLAKSAFDSASAEDKARAKAEAIIKMRFLYYQSNSTLLLSEGDLNFVTPFVDDISLSQAELDFIEQSRKMLNRQKNLLRNRNYIIGTMALLMVIMPFAIIGWYNAYTESYRAKEATKEKVKAQDSLQFAQQEVTVLRKAVTGKEVVQDELAKVLGQSDIGPKLEDAKPVFKSVRIWGKVNGLKGRPLANAEISLLGASVNTARDGSFDFFVFMPPFYMQQEKLSMTIQANGYSEFNYDFKPKTEIKEEFELSPARIKLDNNKVSNIKIQ